MVHNTLFCIKEFSYRNSCSIRTSSTKSSNSFIINAIFASILYGYALSIALREECDVVIALGVHSGDHAIYPDCRPEFYDAISHAFDVGNWDSEKVSFHLPYIDGDKETILRDAEGALTKLKSKGINFANIYSNRATCSGCPGGFTCCKHSL